MKDAVKFEVPQIQLSGKYKIQLFDKDTNELIKEVEKLNVISKIPFSTAFFNHIYPIRRTPITPRRKVNTSILLRLFLLRLILFT